MSTGTPIYHMCIEIDFDSSIVDSKEYFPPTFQADGFIHATEDPKFLLEAGNHFYKSSLGKWTCIKIDPTKLTGGCASVVYEAPAAVGAIEAVDYTNSNSADEAQQEQQQQPQFPHIYGGICADSVLQRFPIVRSNDGSFLEITGLC